MFFTVLCFGALTRSSNSREWFKSVPIDAALWWNEDRKIENRLRPFASFAIVQPRSHPAESWADHPFAYNDRVGTRTFCDLNRSGLYPFLVIINASTGTPSVVRRSSTSLANPYSSSCLIEFARRRHSTTTRPAAGSRSAISNLQVEPATSNGTSMPSPLHGCRTWFRRVNMSRHSIWYWRSRPYDLPPLILLERGESGIEFVARNLVGQKSVAHAIPLLHFW